MSKAQAAGWVGRRVAGFGVWVVLVASGVGGAEGYGPPAELSSGSFTSSGLGWGEGTLTHQFGERGEIITIDLSALQGVEVFRPALDRYQGPQTLKEMYDLAPSGFGYDRYIELETGVTYRGGLWIGGTFNRITSEFEFEGEDVAIVGNGAILDLEGGEITIAYCSNRLDIEDCVIVNGDVKYRGYKDSTIEVHPVGYVGYVTFYKAHDYGVRLWACGDEVVVERNIVVDAVDTGPDFMYLSGEAHGWLPTGTSFSLSMQAGSHELYDNWTYHSDPKINGDPLRHFHFLCDYG